MLVDVEQLAGQVKALDDHDLAALDDAELHDVTILLLRVRARLDAVASESLARWEQRGVWSGDQSRTSTSRLGRELRCSSRSARSALRHARRTQDVPATVAAVRAGDLSPDHIDLLAGAARVAPDRFAAEEPMLVEQCTQLRYADAERMVAYWKQHADPDGAVADADVAKASLHASPTLDDMVVLNGVLDPIGGAIFLGELRRLDQQLRHADAVSGVVRTAAQRRAAALVEMATRSAAMPKGARRPRPLFSVLLGDNGFAGLCELSAGRILPPAALAPYLDSADIETILFDGPSTVLSVSKRRSFTGAVRRAIQVRDRHCQHPSGCDVPAEECDVDHIEPWPDSQRTDQFNGRLECPTHNRHADRHDSDATPAPAREITPDDITAARNRWRHAHSQPDQPDQPDPTDDTAHPDPHGSPA